MWTSFLCLLDYLRNVLGELLSPKKIVSMEDAFVSQFGKRLYDMFFRRYSEKVWGRPCAQMSADWVSQRSKGLSIWTTITNAILKPKQKAQSLIETFPYPRYGYQVISERMREDVEKVAGNRVLLEANVRKVDVTDPSKVVVRYEQRGQKLELEGDYVVSTIALPGFLAYGLEPRPPQAVIEATKGLEFRSICCVNLMLDMPRMTADTWIYCHDAGLGFARLHEPRNWSPDMAPPGKTSVVLEYFCTKGDSTWQKSDQELVDWAVADLVKLELIRKDQVLGGFVERAEEAYPVYHVGYFEKLMTMRNHVEGLERVAIVGRGGTFRYNNADHSVEMGLLTAQMLNGEVDKRSVLAVNTSIEYCENNLVTTDAPVGPVVSPR